MATQLLQKLESGVCTVTLADGASGNVLGPGLIRSLIDAVRGAGQAPGCRVLVLRAEGSAFCRGMDMESILAGDEADARAVAGAFRTCLDEIVASPLPVVACVDGETAGGGVGLVAACDIVIAGARATFVLPEVLLGLIPALIAPVLLRRMPIGRLKYLALASRTLDAADAARFGLVDQVGQDVDADLRTLLKRLLRSSPAAIAACKSYLSALDRSGHGGLDASPEDALLDLARQPGTIEGLRAFANGHAPHWFVKHS